MDPGESTEEAAVRKGLEETGIVARWPDHLALTGLTYAGERGPLLRTVNAASAAGSAAASAAGSAAGTDH